MKETVVDVIRTRLSVCKNGNDIGSWEVLPFKIMSLG